MTAAPVFAELAAVSGSNSPKTDRSPTSDNVSYVRLDSRFSRQICISGIFLPCISLACMSSLNIAS
jgi:hypothetical protein